jgi:hypothetical protein
VRTTVPDALDIAVFRRRLRNLIPNRAFPDGFLSAPMH